jgi:hypothetical protein
VASPRWELSCNTLIPMRHRLHHLDAIP